MSCTLVERRRSTDSTATWFAVILTEEPRNFLHDSEIQTIQVDIQGRGLAVI